MIISTFYRDNANPYPGRLVSVRHTKLSAAERAWRNYVRRCQAERDKIERAEWEKFADAFESLVDAAQGGNHD